MPADTLIREIPTSVQIRDSDTESNGGCMELMTQEKKNLKKTDLGYMPDEWQVYKFGDLILDMKGGASLSKRNYIDHGIKVIPKGGVGRGGLLNIDKDDQNYCSYEYYKKHLNNAVDKKYTIIVLRDLVPSGPNIGLMVNIESDETYILAQGVYGFRVNPELTIPEYLVHLSNSNQYRKLMQSILVGSTQVHVRNTTLKNVEIPLPPTLEEQQSIAEALSDVDELIRSLDGLIQKKEAIKKGTMQHLLTGKKRLPGFDGEWEKKEFGEITQPSNNKVSASSTKLKIPCIELEHIQKENGHLDGFNDLREQKSMKTKFNEGDVLFGKLRPYLRKFYRADFDGACSTEIWVFDSIDGYSNEYLFYLIQLEGFIDAANKSTGTHMPRADWNVVKEYSISVPSYIREQKAIAQILSDMDRELQTLRQKREKYKQIKQGMMQELLTGKTRLV